MLCVPFKRASYPQRKVCFMCNLFVPKVMKMPTIQSYLYLPIHGQIFTKIVGQLDKI